MTINYEPKKLLPMALPKKNVVFQDPAFSTKLVRVSDESDGKINSVLYSYWPVLNCDSTKIFITCDGVPTLFSFNPATMQATHIGPMFYNTEPMIAEGMTWSTSDPNIIYGISGWQSNVKLRAYNVSSRQYVYEHDFTTAGELPKGSCWQMSKSRVDDETFSFAWKSGDGAPWKYCVVFNRKLNKTWKFDLQAADGISNFNECRLDSVGLYLLMVDDGGNQYLWVPSTDRQNQRIIIPSNVTEKAAGHYDVGTTMIVQPDIWGNNGNRIIKRALLSPHQPIDLFDSGVKDWSQSHHVSLLGPTEEYALITTNASSPDYSVPVMSEIFLVKTDGSGQIIRLCQHRSSCKTYELQPHGNLSGNGRFFAYHSDSGQPDGRLDVFIGAIDPAIWSTTAPAPQPTPPATAPPKPQPKTPPAVPPAPKPAPPVIPPRNRRRQARKALN